ncbi:MAG: hypothetical protein GY812_06245 [Actinomycetia bacterium]|nr:hypothetical protein [Actinomycetes bacterium]
MAFSDPPTEGTASTESPTGEAPAEPAWTDQVTDLVVDTVGKVRSRTTGPVLNVAHASVYGIVAAIIVIPIVIAFFAGLIKGLNWLIPGDIWIVYTIIAAMMWLLGWALWLQRDRSGNDAG